MTTVERPDYGIDAPGVVRNLAIAGALCLGVAAAAGFSAARATDTSWPPNGTDASAPRAS